MTPTSDSGIKALTLALFPWQDFPFGHDNVVEHLQANICTLLAAENHD